MNARGSDADQANGEYPLTEDDAVGSHQASPPPPRIFGDYRLVREVGRGGMGVVYEARQISLARRVALKVLSHGLGDAGRRRRFESEARAAGRLHHTNIVPVFGVGEHDGMPYYVMQFIEGVGLDALLDASPRPPAHQPTTEQVSGSAGAWSDTAGDWPHGRADLTALAEVALRGGGDDTEQDFSLTPLPTRRGAAADVDVGAEPEGWRYDGPESAHSPGGAPPAQRLGDWKWVARLGVQAANGLDYAHSKGVFHRDVKPSNLLLDDRGTLWIADFGLAQWDEHHDLTQSGFVVGTLRYLAPEAFDGVYGRTGDVYGLGLTLYELLARRPAFDGHGRARLMGQVNAADPTPLRKIDRRIPIDLATVVHKAIAKRPEDRYQTAAELEADLQRFLDDRPVKVRRPSHAERYWRWARRNPAIAVLGAVLTALLVVATAASLFAAWRFQVLASQREEALQKAVVASDKLTEAQRGIERRLYDTRAVLAASDWENDDYGGFRSMVDLMRPSHGEADLRGWEWRYLRGLADEERLVVRTPRESIAAVAASPDGKGFATLSLTGAMRIWRLDDGRPKLVVSAPNPSGRPADLRIGIQSLAYSPDGRRIAGPAGGGAVGIFDAETGERARVLGDEGMSTLSVAWSPDGERLFAGLAGFVVRVWETATGKELPPLKAPGVKQVAAVAVSPDGRLCASADFAGVVRIWSLGDAPTLLHSIDAHEGEARALAFAPDGKRLASAGLDGAIRIWDAASGGLRLVVRAHRGGVLSLAWPREGGWIASGGNDNAVRTWDGENGRLLHRFLGHTDGVRALAATSDGLAVISGAADGVAKVWDPRREARPRTLSEPSMLGGGGGASCVVLSPDGRTLASGHFDSIVRIWDVRSGRLLRALDQRARASRVRAVAFSPDGRLLASCTGEPKLPAESRGIVTVWDVGEGRPIRDYSGHLDVVDDLAFLDDRRVASGGGDRAVHVWDAATGERLATLSGHKQGVRKLALARGARALASGTDEGEVRVWDVDTYRERTSIQSEGDVLALALSADGGRVAASFRDGPIRLWDLARPGPPRVLDDHIRDVNCLAFTPDGRLASGGADKCIRIWELEGERVVLTLREHAEAVSGLAIGCDGGVLASSSHDHTIKLWSAPPAD